MMAKSGDLRAISIRQPWAYAILHFGKDVENKPLRTHYRGRILIHSSLTVEDRQARKLGTDPDEMTTGAIIGSVEIIDCIKKSKSIWAVRGQFHWILKNPLVIDKPIPFKGALGWITVPKRLLSSRRFRKPIRRKCRWPKRR